MNRDCPLTQLEEVAEIYQHRELAGPNERFHAYLRDRLIPHQGGRSALEFGCGKGLWTRVLCDRYNEVDVVDGSARLLEDVAGQCGNRRAKLTTHHALVEDFQPLSRQWQHVYLTFFLEHLEDPLAVLRRVKDCLSADGRLFVAVPNAHSIHRVVAQRMGLIARVDQLSDNDRRVGHRRVYSRDLLRRHVISAGYEIVAEGAVGLKVVSLKQMEGWSSELVEAFCASGNLAPANAAYLTLQAGCS